MVPDHQTQADTKTEKPLHDLSAERLQIASTAVGVASIFVVAFLIQAVFHTLVLAYAPAVAENDWYPWVISAVPMYGVAMPISLLLFHLGSSEPPPKRKLRPIVFWGLLATSFTLAYIGDFIGNTIGNFISTLTGEPVEKEVVTMAASYPFWLNLLFGGILAPIFEELFYRKIVIDRLRRYGDLPAILISGLMFGLLHGNVSQFFYTTVFGMLFGYIYINTGKIRYTIALHMSINIVSGVLATEVSRGVDADLLNKGLAQALAQNAEAALAYICYIALILLLFVAGIVSAVLLFLHCRKPLRRAENPLTAKEWVRVLALNPGVWMFAVMVVLLFL